MGFFCCSLLLTLAAAAHGSCGSLVTSHMQRLILPQRRDKHCRSCWMLHSLVGCVCQTLTAQA